MMLYNREVGLKTLKNASHASSEECTYQGIPSIYSYKIDVSSVIVAGGLQKVHSKQKTLIKYLVSSISISSKHCRSALTTQLLNGRKLAEWLPSYFSLITALSSTIN